MIDFTIRYLNLEEVLYIHKNQIEEYGGSSGVRDLKLLESALAQPMAAYQNEEFHKDIFDKASAYIFYICNNHPFIDGNKRVALATALIFLDLNKIEINDPSEKLYDLVMGVAEGKNTLESIKTLLKTLSE